MNKFFGALVMVCALTTAVPAFAWDSIYRGGSSDIPPVSWPYGFHGTWYPNGRLVGRRDYGGPNDMYGPVGGTSGYGYGTTVRHYNGPPFYEVNGDPNGNPVGPGAVGRICQDNVTGRQWHVPAGASCF